MKVVLKGIVTREEAELAVQNGADGVFVSNHGGRAENSLRGSIDCLPEVVAGVKGRVPVLIDSGVRRGADIFKALALGADAVGIGRPYVWGLGAFGQEGVDKVIDSCCWTSSAMIMRQTRTATLDRSRAAVRVAGAAADHDAGEPPRVRAVSRLAGLSRGAVAAVVWRAGRDRAGDAARPGAANARLHRLGDLDRAQLDVQCAGHGGDQAGHRRHAGAGLRHGVQTATVTVPLKAFRCPNDEMNQHLNEAMKSDKFPEIVFKMDKYTVAGTRAEAAGTMTITGNSQPVTVPLTFTKGEQGVQIEGNTRVELAGLRHRAADRLRRDAEGRPPDPHRVQGHGRALSVIARPARAACKSGRPSSPAAPGAAPRDRRSDRPRRR